MSEPTTPAGCVAHGGPDCICPPVCTSEDCHDPTIGHRHPQTAEQLAGLAVNAARALADERRHYEIACRENVALRAEVERLTTLLGEYADRAIANGQRAREAEAARDAARARSGGLRAEITGDINRMRLPAFPADETPENVARTTRAICMRIARDGADAPYYVAADTGEPT